MLNRFMRVLLSLAVLMSLSSGCVIVADSEDPCRDEYLLYLITPSGSTEESVSFLLYVDCIAGDDYDD